MLDFPNNPPVGQIYTSPDGLSHWRFDGTKWLGSSEEAAAVGGPFLPLSGGTMTGTHANVVDVTAATITGAAWNGPLKVAASGGGSGAPVTVTAPVNTGYAWNETGNATDAKTWDALSGSGTLTFRAVNDANSAATNWLTVTRSGYVPQVITLAAPTIVTAGALTVSASGGPTIRSGTGAATGTQPKGSIWLRTDGAAGSTLYVTQGGGTWAAVAGV